MGKQPASHLMFKLALMAVLTTGAFARTNVLYGNTHTTASFFNPRQAADNVAEYLHTHPAFNLDVLFWLLVGTVLWTAGLCCLLISEIGAVLVCRDQDFRERLLKAESVSVSIDEEQYKELVKKENRKLEFRPYISMVGMGLLLVGTGALVVPLCDVLSIVGLPEAPCLVLATVGAFFATVCFVTFLMGLIWSCTRPWAAAVLFLISLTGQVLLPSGNPLLLLLWLALVFGGGYVYFFTIPQSYAKDGVQPPFYVQGIGPFTVELSAARFGRAADDAHAALRDSVGLGPRARAKGGGEEARV